MSYYFGIYHWRRRGRALALGTLALAAGALLAVASTRRTRRLLAVALGLWGARTDYRTLSKLLRPPPWRLDGEKYALLAAALPLDGADRVLDVGCGTGRSLVGLAPTLAPETTVVGVDVFDDRVILGNAPALARRNAVRAGLDAAVVRGDAARLPVADGSVDVVTACRVLHDLPEAAARRAAAEAHRVCAPGGTLGVLELRITHDGSTDPARYWRDLVAEAGFDVRHVEEVERERGRYVLVVADA
ncbi:class I SAM-dependent methyltransferase [Halomarina ordinaria]|uniref:Class I SAM-dependent methyltransferase n=1 Tax=Halomarina ordinaria TaxID=3033939 RepID=A0ABD5UEE8_9EURY|nr:class I SAM-dependent methyltransferase [Halomarina sp. PSRA2]